MSKLRFKAQDLARLVQSDIPNDPDLGTIVTIKYVGPFKRGELSWRGREWTHDNDYVIQTSTNNLCGCGDHQLEPLNPPKSDDTDSTDERDPSFVKLLTNLDALTEVLREQKKRERA